ncbi:GH25 family lysozyme [Lentilactobacillus senioris]|uniref:GH25 family lysozyme n=1 Tax=Lentilactobacillus senioris TaxID=931534 RepID=UPI003D2E01AC
MGRKDIQPIYTQTYQQKRRSMIIYVLIAVILLSIFGGWLGYKYYEKQQLKKYPITGVVLSQNDGYVDFDALKKAQVDFVYLKATQGAAFSDDSFNSNYSRSQGAQLPVGVYHVFSFSSTVNSQYHNVISQVKTNTGSLPLAIYIDYYGTYSDDNVDWQATRKKFIKLAKKLTHYYQRPLLFWGPKSVLDHLDVKVGTKYQLWYSDGTLGKPNGDARFLSVPGKPVIDLSGTEQSFNQAVFNGNQAKWEQYLSVNIN